MCRWLLYSVCGAECEAGGNRTMSETKLTRAEVEHIIRQLDDERSNNPLVEQCIQVAKALLDVDDAAIRFIRCLEDSAGARTVEAGSELHRVARVLLRTSQISVLKAARLEREEQV